MAHSYIDPRKHHTQWCFIAPLSGLRLTNAVKKEFTVSRVTFVDREKLPRIGRRLGIPLRNQEIKKQIIESNYYDAANAQTFALLRYTGTPAELSKKCLRLLKDELDILAMSQLGFGKRRFNSHPSLKGDQNSGKISYLFFDPNSPARVYNNQLTGKFGFLDLDYSWKRYHQKVFYFKLLKVLNKQIPVSDSWSEHLKRAAVMIGQSQCSNDIAQSFLWNMIVLEMLLTEQGDKYSEALPKRIEAFLGWVGYWSVLDYEKRIKDIYHKRCKFVHDGLRDKIEIADLLFTDDLLLNLMVNLVNHIQIFSSKEAVINFADKVEAEHILGIKSKVRPKTLQFFSRSYTDDDFQEI